MQDPCYRQETFKYTGTTHRQLRHNAAVATSTASNADLKMSILEI